MITTRTSGPSSARQARTSVDLPDPVGPENTRRISLERMHAASSSLTASGRVPNPTRSAKVTLPSVLRRRANDTCWDTSRVAARRKPVAEAHHQQRDLAVELPLGPPRGAGQMGQPRLHLRLGRPQPLLQRLDRAVGPVDEHQVEPGRHHLLHRLVGQQQLDGSEPDRQGQHPLDQRPFLVRGQPRRTGRQPVGVDALQLLAQHLVGQRLLAAPAQPGAARLQPGRGVGDQRVLHRPGQLDQQHRVRPAHPATSTLSTR